MCACGGTLAMPRSASWWMLRGALPARSLKALSPSLTHPVAAVRRQLSTLPMLQSLLTVSLERTLELSEVLTDYYGT